MKYRQYWYFLSIGLSLSLFLPKSSAVLSLSEQLSHLITSLAGIVPEMFLGLFLLILLVAELGVRFSKHVKETGKIAVNVSIVGALGYAALLYFQESSYEVNTLFFGGLISDEWANFYKFILVGAWLFILAHIRFLKYEFSPETTFLLASIVWAAALLTMASNFLVTFLCVEIISIGSYLLVALAPNKPSTEAGIKYLLYGAIASAVTLYGISFLYGFSGTLDFDKNALGSGLAANPPWVSLLAIFMTLAGLLFKLSLAPFHMWAPDAYEATPSPLVSFLSVVPKVGVLMVLIRLLKVLPESAGMILGGVALLSMTLGNTGALWQKKTRRLLAYSSISQAGYLLAGIVTGLLAGVHAATYYLVVYALMNLSVFFLTDIFAAKNDWSIGDYAGWGRRYWPIGVALTLALIGLAGLPPTAGLIAKWYVFSSLWEAYSLKQPSWQLWLIVGGLLNAGIALVYYLKIPFQLFFRPLPNGIEPGGRMTGAVAAAAVLGLLIVILFLMPDALMKSIEEIG